MVVGALVRCGRQAARFQASPLFRYGSLRCSSSAAEFYPSERIRNIGISAHIDSGKTTLTERVLFYTGKIDTMHEVRGKDNVGATMDSMELERQRGITIQSAATYSTWKDTNINIIDTPGHVDFTVEVERALRVLDGAILVLCAVGGVQSQTLTVNRQMKRYGVPCIAFINKLDRWNASHTRALKMMRSKLGHNAAFVQLPIGLERDFSAIIDIVEQETLYFDGDHGMVIRKEPIPEDMLEEVQMRRQDLLESLANVDEEIGELFLEEKEPTKEQLKAAIRRNCVTRKFTPVFVGSALKNKGVQPLLDGVLDYLPNPAEVENTALIVASEGEKIVLENKREDITAPFLGLAFKLENGKYGQLTYMRIYQGMLEKGSYLLNTRTNKKVRVPRIVRMHSQNMEDISSVRAGDIAAFFGVDCNSGDTFMPVKVEAPHSHLTMESMHVPEPVISLSVKPNKPTDNDKFTKAVTRFTKEDPTFKVHLDEESKETIFSGMGELHLEIYVERLKREYDCPATVGRPRVAYRETLNTKVEFDCQHKKQTGGHGQYGRVIGYFEPLPREKVNMLEFVDKTIGACIPKSYMPAIEKGFRECATQGVMSDYNIGGVKMVLTDGVQHEVDSSDAAFFIAAYNATKQAFSKGCTTIMEPIMDVEIAFPQEFNKNVLGLISKRRGAMTGSEHQDDYHVVSAEIPLHDMFGFSTDLRACTQGKGEFSMEFQNYEQAPPASVAEIFKATEDERNPKKKKK